MPSIRRVTTIGGEIEYAPDPVRRITTIGGEIEYVLPQVRRITMIGMMIEYVEEQPAARWVGMTDYARPVMIGVQGVRIY